MCVRVFHSRIQSSGGCRPCTPAGSIRQTPERFTTASSTLANAVTAVQWAEFTGNLLQPFHEKPQKLHASSFAKECFMVRRRCHFFKLCFKRSSPFSVENSQRPAKFSREEICHCGAIEPCKFPFKSIHLLCCKDGLF